MTRDAFPVALPVAAADVIIEPADSDGLAARQCARCRKMFEGDPTLDIRARNDWCLCPSCEAILLPSRARRTNVIEFRRPAPIGVEHPAGQQ